MKKETILCDICGVEKGETNHWYRAFQKVWKGGSDFTVTTWDHPGEEHTYGIDGKDLCGEACAGKALSIFVGEVKNLSEEKGYVKAAKA